MSRLEVRSAEALVGNLKANLDRLAEAAAKNETRKEALLRFRELVNRIELEVHSASKTYQLRQHPRVDAMIAFAIECTDAFPARGALVSGGRSARRRPSECLPRPAAVRAEPRVRAPRRSTGIR